MRAGLRGWTMRVIGPIAGGMLGGVIGAAVWAVVTCANRWEIGWIAWGIGGLVGYGVHLGGRGRGGIQLGGTAVVLAVAAVLLGKWAVVRIELSAFLDSDEAPIGAIADIIVAEREEAGQPVYLPPEDVAQTVEQMYPPDIWNEALQRWEAMDAAQQEAVRELPILANPHVWVAWLADDVVEEHMDAGRAVNWPPGYDYDSAWREPHYPTDVWAEAVRRWEGMSPPEQEAHMADVAEQLRWMLMMSEQDILFWAFVSSFTLFDLLWVGLAVATAARIGARGPWDLSFPQPVGFDADAGRPNGDAGEGPPRR